MKSSLVLVGGASACKVRLRHDRVSRFHCSLVRGPLGVWAVDLLSRDGTRVNGESVPWARLMEGDRLQIGPFELRIWYEEPRRRRSTGVSPVAHRRDACATGPAVRSDSPPEVLDRSLLLPVMNEFNRMQGQMMDQFHQTLVMMAEMFTTLHREQAGLVREELAEMRRLTQELNALKAEQARQGLDRLSAPARARNRRPPPHGRRIRRSWSKQRKGRPSSRPNPPRAAGCADGAISPSPSGCPRLAEPARGGVAGRAERPVAENPAFHHGRKKPITPSTGIGRLIQLPGWGNGPAPPAFPLCRFRCKQSFFVERPSPGRRPLSPREAGAGAASRVTPLPVPRFS